MKKQAEKESTEKSKGGSARSVLLSPSATWRETQWAWVVPTWAFFQTAFGAVESRTFIHCTEPPCASVLVNPLSDPAPGLTTTVFFQK